MTIQKKYHIMPLHVQKIRSSPRYQAMADHQQAWFLNLLMAEWEAGGYLPLDGNLWRLAGARTKQFFDRESAVVLDCFKRRGNACGMGIEIYNVRLLACLAEVDSKHKSQSDRGKKGRNFQLGLSIDDENKEDSGSAQAEPLVSSFDNKNFSLSKNLKEEIQKLFDFYRQECDRNAGYELTQKRFDKAEKIALELLKGGCT